MYHCASVEFTLLTRVLHHCNNASPLLCGHSVALAVETIQLFWTGQDLMSGLILSVCVSAMYWWSYLLTYSVNTMRWRWTSVPSKTIPLAQNPKYNVLDEAVPLSSCIEIYHNFPYAKSPSVHRVWSER